MTTALPRVVLAARREAPFLGRHPWIFSGSIDRVEGDVDDGDEVRVTTWDGAFVARGLYNGRSQIRVRLYAWTDEPLDPAFFRRRILDAVDVRRRLGLLAPGGGCRLVFSEADGASGVTVDRYADWLIVQFTSLAMHRRRDTLLEALEDTLEPRGMLLRTERGILEEEGLEISDGSLRGPEPDGPIEIDEHGLRYRVDLRTGQKTGFYLDQRENRRRAAHLAPGRRVADVCCYTGGFTLPLLRAGAVSVTGVDVSGPALRLAASNVALNGLDDGRASFVESDAFGWLENEAARGGAYDMVVVDPPRFARSSRGVAQAIRGYRRLNEAAVRCLEPGGLLVTCSCTGRVSRSQFQSVLADVEVRTGRRIRILESHGQPADHPVSPTCPETAYLKCLVCRVE